MARADAPRERIGEMLLSLGLITRAQLDDALKSQGGSGLPIGKQLVALGSVSETRLTQVLSNQLSVPWVSLERVEFPAELLARIPAELADRRSVLPIYVRSVRGRGATLYVAMDDPTDEDALQELSNVASMPVRPMIAPPSEIRRAIEQRYFGASGRRATHSEPATGLRAVPKVNGKPPAAPPVTASDAKSPKAKKPPPPPDAKTARPEGVVSIEQYETPSQPPPAAAQPQRTLTLLDGTQIKLPSAKAAGAETSEVRAVRHVVKAIRSARSDKSVEDPLSWHDIVQTLLDALEGRSIRLSRREIADAWERARQKRAASKNQKT
jgi:type IV pilus assembly protein PilB